jgi:uncharacterized protein YciI
MHSPATENRCVRGPAVFTVIRAARKLRSSDHGQSNMWYVIYSIDRPDSLPARQSARDGHLARLQDLLQEGRLLLAGPRPAIDCEDPGPAGFQGSLVVAAFDTLDEAQAWADADPYVTAGVYESVEVSPFRRVLPR